jgi:hypothetical protein
MITIALTLLVSAMQLLTLVANNPNIDAEFKANAINIANQAIVVAQEEITKANTPAEPLPTNIGNMTPEPTVSISEPTINKEIITELTRTFEPKDGTPFGEYIIRVGYKENGKYKGTDFTFTNTGETKDSTGSERSVRDLENNILYTAIETFFVYAPESKGDKVLNFTANGIDKDFTITVK